MSETKWTVGDVMLRKVSGCDQWQRHVVIGITEDGRPIVKGEWFPWWLGYRVVDPDECVKIIEGPLAETAQ